MKRQLSLAAIILIIQTGLITAGNQRHEPPVKEADEVTVSATPATEALTSEWVNAFRLTYPQRRVNLVSQANSTAADIHIIAPGSESTTVDPSTWKIVVGRDVIVPVMRISDPYLISLSDRGISPGEFAEMLTNDGTYTWGKLLGTEKNTPVSVIIPGDEAAIDALSRFASVTATDITATRSSLFGDNAGTPALKPGSIAFCRLADITDGSGRQLISGIQIVPIDVNGNAKSDYFEQFYSGFDEFTRGVYIGKYPRSLCNNIYAASATAPAGGAPAEFVSFLLVDGQRFLAGSRYTPLAYGEGVIKSESLASGQMIVTGGSAGDNTLKAWLWVLAVIVSVSMVAWVVYLFTRSRMKEEAAAVFKAPAAFSPGSLTIPAGILYDRGHIWTFMEKDGTVRVGIDDFLQHVTGTMTRIGMKPRGERIRRGDTLLSVVQNGKKLDLRSPVSGTVLSRNEKVMSDADTVRHSPYEEGWIYSVEPDSWEKESRMLIAAGRYRDFLKEEFGRIRDFLAVAPGINDAHLSRVVLQDGGEFKEGFLEGFGPEVWEEFQMRFL
jgi:glycine cleavage system H lipoate-binding protein